MSTFPEHNDEEHPNHKFQCRCHFGFEVYTDGPGWERVCDKPLTNRFRWHALLPSLRQHLAFPMPPWPWRERRTNGVAPVSCRRREHGQPSHACYNDCSGRGVCMRGAHQPPPAPPAASARGDALAEAWKRQEPPRVVAGRFLRLRRRFFWHRLLAGPGAGSARGGELQLVSSGPHPRG